VVDLSIDPACTNDGHLQIRALAVEQLRHLDESELSEAVGGIVVKRPVGPAPREK
jgi:hypothetical protein